MASLLPKLKSFFSRITPSLRFSGRLGNITASLKNPEVKKRLFYTLLFILLFRFLAAIPVPGVDVRLYQETFANNPINNTLSALTGGQLDKPTLVAFGVGAYINASIIIQLLQTVLPKFEELSKEGERGRKVLNQYTRMLAVPLSLIQTLVIYGFIKNNPSSEVQSLLESTSGFSIALMVMSFTAGSILLMWIGELMTEYGIGNGTSIIISVGILSSLPKFLANDFSFLSSDWNLLKQGNFNVLTNDNFRLFFLVILSLIILVTAIVYVTEAIRKIPIHYARRAGGASNYLPLKINQAGVIPVIFASTMLSFPQILAQLFTWLGKEGTTLRNFADKINGSFLLPQNHLPGTNNFVYYEMVLFVLIIAFTFFYTFVNYKPSETAENLQKSGGFVPGIRPGVATQSYITYILIRLTTVGSLFLAFIALVPAIMRLAPGGTNLTLFTGIGGTSLLIVIGVILETIRQLESMNLTSSYDKYK